MTRTIRPVGDDEWELVAWLWQAYRSDLAPIVRGLPYADGRYAHGPLDGYPGPDRAGYLAWQPHPNTGSDAPVGFALVSGPTASGGTWMRSGPHPSRAAAGSASSSRRTSSRGIPGRGRSPSSTTTPPPKASGGGWPPTLFGPEGEAWTEEQRPVPGKPEVPPDHWIETAL